MKNNIKKIMLLSTSTFAAVGASAIVGIGAIGTSNTSTGVSTNNIQSQAVKNENFDPNKPLVFNGKTYKNIYQAIDSYVLNPANVSEKNFVGDINDAISITNDYEIVNTNKLREYDVTKINKAYKTLNDGYVSSIETAKKSYLKDPIIGWSDIYGNIFDTENEAKEYINEHGNFTSPISYYEIKDYARKDENGQPTVYRINPLNKKDINELKRIAAENILVEGSGFTLERMSFDGSKNEYIDNDFKGQSDAKVNSIVNDITNSVTNPAKNQMWLNNKVLATPDRPYIEGWMRTGISSVIKGNFAINYVTNGNNWTATTNYSQLLEQSVVFTDKNEFRRYYQKWNDFGHAKTPYQNAEMYDGLTLFGGIRPSFEIMEHQKTILKQGVRESWLGNDVDFLGDGKQANIFFSFNPNQDAFYEMKKDPAFASAVESNAQKAVNEAIQNLRTNLAPYFSAGEISNIIDNIQEPVKKAVTEKMIGQDQIWINSVKSTSQVKAGLDRIDNIILDSIDAHFTSKTGKSFSQTVTERVRSKEQYVENKNSNDIIYTVDFNGVPLFKLDKSLWGSLYDKNEEAFRTAPLSEVKLLIQRAYNEGRDNTLKNMVNGMVNISNSFLETNNTNPNLIFETKLTKDVIDSKGAKVNFGLTSKNVTNNFDASYSSKFINEEQFRRWDLYDSNLEKGLNLRESDEENLLLSNKGTFQAIDQYNENLERYLATNNPSQIHKDNIASNIVTDPNDIVWLFNSNKSLYDIKYSEYFNNGNKFNESLSDGSLQLVKSIEAKQKELELSKLNKPSKVVVVKDYNGNVLSSEKVNYGVADDYSKEQAYKNAMNKVDVKESLDYILYKEEDGSETLLKNVVTKLNVLNINRAGVKSTYGFLKYQDLYDYLFDYIKLNSDGNGATLPNTPPPFSAESIDVSALTQVLGGITSFSQINDATPEELFHMFGKAFGIADQNAWNMYIKDVNANPKSAARANEAIATISIELQDGFAFADGSSTLNIDVPYTPSEGLDPIPGGEQNTQAVTATIASVTTSIVLILLLEVILISVIVINKRKNENANEKKLMKLVKANNTTSVKK